jgi:transposase InsO family protein
VGKALARKIEAAEAVGLGDRVAGALEPAASRIWARGESRNVIEMGAPADAQMTLELTAPVGPNLSQEDRAEAERRFGIIEPLIDRPKYHLLYIQFPRMSQVYEYLAKQHSVKARTIYRWLQAWQQGGLPALVRKDRADKGTARAMNQAAQELLIKLSTPQKDVYGILPVREMWRVYEGERVWRAAHTLQPMGEFDSRKYAMYLDGEGRLTPAAQLPPVSYETFRTWFKRIPEMLRTLARDGVEAYRNREEIISHRDIAAVDPMAYIVMDHRRLDVFCLVKERGAWKLARPWLTAAIDMRTRKWVSWCIVESPSSDSIACCLKRLFVDYGLPKSLYWDNGRDFTCQWFEGLTRKERREKRIDELDGAWRGVLGTLDIRVHHAIAYNARAKIIEPNFNRISNIDRKLPEWCGNNSAERPERLDEMVAAHEKWVKGERESTPFRTIEQIASLYNAAIRDVNEMELKGDGMRKATPSGYGWMCPNEAWEALIGRVPRRDAPADVLHMCFAKRRDIKVQHGEISTTHDGRVYHYRMVNNSLELMRLNGKTVELAYDPLDLGEAAVYYESRFFGLVKCVELRRMGETGFVEDMKDRARANRELRKAIRAVHRSAPAPSFEERLARRAEVLPARAEVPRVEIPAAIAAPVADAAEAARSAAAPPEDVAVEKVAAAETSTDDGEFNFFG